MTTDQTNPTLPAYPAAGQYLIRRLSDGLYYAGDRHGFPYFGRSAKVCAHDSREVAIYGHGQREFELYLIPTA